MAVSTIYNTPMLAQVGAFSPIVMSTPGSDGNYRVNLYMWAPTFGQAQKDIVINVAWVDPSGTTQSTGIGLFTANSSINAAHGDATFRAIAGSNITLQYAGNSTDTTDSYNLYPNLEQL